MRVKLVLGSKILTWQRLAELSQLCMEQSHPTYLAEWLCGCVAGAMAASLSRSGWMMWIRLGTAGLGVLMGCMVFFVFTFGYGNIAAGSWALISAMFAGLVLHLHMVFKVHRLELWYSAKR